MRGSRQTIILAVVVLVILVGGVVILSNLLVGMSPLGGGSAPPTNLSSLPTQPPALPTKAPAQPTTVPLTRVQTSTAQPTRSLPAVSPTSEVGVVPTREGTLVIAQSSATAEAGFPTLTQIAEVPTATPLPTDTMIPGDDLTSTAAIDAAEAQSTLLARTSTAPPQKLAPLLITATRVSIQDDAGRVMGDGQVRVYAPAELGADSTDFIQVEIEANPQSSSTFVPSMTPSPVLATPQATPTPLHLVDNGRQFIIVRECMDVDLHPARPDLFHITLNVSNAVGAIQQVGQVYWWQWIISPVGAEAIGTSTFTVTVHPSDCATKEAFSAGAVSIPFAITVTGGSAASPLAILAIGLVVVIAIGAVGFVVLRSRLAPGPVSPLGKDSIFISYRRDDSSDITGRIYDHLIGYFGKGAVFKDVYSIPYGVDFREHLRGTLKSCRVMLVVIGDRWLTVADSDGKRRLEDPGDFVRAEVETGMHLGMLVIPLLVRGATMPSERDLPGDLKPLAYRNGTPIRNDPDFPTDMDRLIKSIVEEMKRKPR
ncbi:MAG TPA: TIR domain-containing protein [Aggregatilineales bacterium]|nr:TIR domain-containing protein [Aggregatilineales bacterium]